VQKDAFDSTTGYGNLRFASDAAEPLLAGDLDFGDERHILLEGGGEHPPVDGEHAPGLGHGFIHAAGDIGHRSQEQVAEAVPFQSPIREAVLEKLGHQALVVGERSHVAAQITRGQNA